MDGWEGEREGGREGGRKQASKLGQDGMQQYGHSDHQNIKILPHKLVKTLSLSSSSASDCPGCFESSSSSHKAISPSYNWQLKSHHGAQHSVLTGNLSG